MPKFFLRPSLFAVCNNTFSKWWEGLRMASRRVLSSTPLLVRGSETLWDSGERKLTNKNYKDYNGLESGKQVVGPVSAQSLVDWRLGECGNKFIGVCRAVNSVMGAEATDFFFYWWYLEVLMDDWVWHVPGGIHYQTQGFRLKTFQNFNVGIWGRICKVCRLVSVLILCSCGL
jgi:hypothetical protein